MICESQKFQKNDKLIKFPSVKSLERGEWYQIACQTGWLSRKQRKKSF